MANPPWQWEWKPRPAKEEWRVLCVVGCAKNAEGIASNGLSIKPFCQEHAELFMMDKMVNG